MDYTCAAVSIGSSEVDFSANCGNISAAVGPYAYNHGLVPRTKEPKAIVRIYNTNTSKLIHSTFRVTEDGKEAAIRGDYAIDGVSGTGADIKLSFLNPVGSKTGALVPTGHVVEKLDGTEVSCVDAATACVFVRAADVGLRGTELPDVILQQRSLLDRLETIRCLGAQAMRLCNHPSRSPNAVPKIVMVSKPAEHELLSGEYQRAHDVDIVARVMANRQPHRAIPLTVALSIAVAATVKGSVVEAMLGLKRAREGVLTIAHPSGAIQVRMEKGKASRITAADVFRTSRPIMDGWVYY